MSRLGVGREWTEQQLLEAARRNEPAAVGELYRLHVDAARRLARMLTRRAQPDDVVSEAFMRVFSAMRSDGGPDLSFRPYLLSTVRRQVLDQELRSSREVPTELALLDGPAAVWSSAVQDDDQEMMRRVLARMPARWRQVLWEAEVQGRPAREIAKLADISANTAAALIYRARQRLRQEYLAEHLLQAPTAELHAMANLLPGFVRGSLGTTQRDQVALHVESCLSCRSHLDRLEIVDRSFAALDLAPLLLLIAPFVLKGAAPFAGHSLVRTLWGLSNAHTTGAWVALASSAATVAAVGVVVGVNAGHLTPSSAGTDRVPIASVVAPASPSSSKVISTEQSQITLQAPASPSPRTTQRTAVPTATTTTAPSSAVTFETSVPTSTSSAREKATSKTYVAPAAATSVAAPVSVNVPTATSHATASITAPLPECAISLASAGQPTLCATR